MQRFFCIGNLTKKPESYQTQSGNNVCKFTVAVNRQYNKEQADFFTIVAWNGLCETCQKYLDKGSKVAIIGHIENRSFTDSNGNNKTYNEVIAQEITFLSHTIVKDKEKNSPSYVEQELPF